MTYLEILSYARKGIDAEIEKLRSMQEKAIEGQANDIMRYAQEKSTLWKSSVPRWTRSKKSTIESNEPKPF